MYKYKYSLWDYNSYNNAFLLLKFDFNEIININNSLYSYKAL